MAISYANLTTPLVLPYAASVALDLALSADFVIGLLTGPIAFTFLNPTAGRQGVIVVQQDGSGGRTVMFTAPATYTIVRDSNLVDLSAATALSAITLYPYALFATGGTNYFYISKALLV